jgi:hypothetical protein
MIFSESAIDCVEICMDDLTIYGDTFEEALNNIEKVMIVFQETNLSLNNEKFHMLHTEGVVLGHHISTT